MSRVPQSDVPLPLPAGEGGPDLPFAEAVDAYVAAHGASRQECFRRISEHTGNTVGTLNLRYRDRGDQVWLMSSSLANQEVPESTRGAMQDVFRGLARDAARDLLEVAAAEGLTPEKAEALTRAFIGRFSPTNVDVVDELVGGQV